jgi:hypothetical protein
MAMRPRYRIAFIDQSIRGGSMRLPWDSDGLKRRQDPYRFENS